MCGRCGDCIDIICRLEQVAAGFKTVVGVLLIIMWLVMEGFKDTRPYTAEDWEDRIRETTMNADPIEKFLVECILHDKISVRMLFAVSFVVITVISVFMAVALNSWVRKSNYNGMTGWIMFTVVVLLADAAVLGALLIFAITSVGNILVHALAVVYNAVAICVVYSYRSEVLEITKELKPCAESFKLVPPSHTEEEMVNSPSRAQGTYIDV